MRIVTLVCLLSGLAGCFGGGAPAPQNHYYHLADVPSELKAVQGQFGVVAVQSLRSDSLHQERSILYSLKSAPLMLNTYYYHLWTNSPGQLIQDYLVNYLRAVGFADNIVRYGDLGHSDGVVSGYIQHFERIIGDGKPQVLVRLELTYRSSAAAKAFVLTRVYQAQRTADDESMESSVAAFSQALASICSHFSRDVIHAYKAQKS
jgi:ABC-type uncharacterized transport system auxiliary subunit